MLDKKLIKEIKRIYQEGTRVKLEKMVDIQAPPSGTEGSVTFVDDVGTIHVKWDNGSTLGLIPNEDKWRKVR